MIKIMCYGVYIKCTTRGQYIVYCDFSIGHIASINLICPVILYLFFFAIVLKICYIFKFGLVTSKV
jgi:hypothetical protein